MPYYLLRPPLYILFAAQAPSPRLISSPFAAGADDSRKSLRRRRPSRPIGSFRGGIGLDRVKLSR
ncbi:hypothetical protein MUK42_32828 [Musa troglodytarum]|uniref:Uncharacterized protein n=1 Tax=Musa troglodytarum TaxID=320322 RepID=A0A9E7I6L3_9LILI|nr:hypothetical protein MUK42_32828 [Musa troglodytarum]URE46847.1 hypothetical protein MUK42_32828 [Musa troglodytarum]